MKKNNALMRASGILLVLTLGTSCFVGGTFAKYVTENQGNDTARVAKWGVAVAVTGNAFNTTYGKDDTTGYEDPDGHNITTTVSSAAEVVAPGTYGTFGGVKITGQPEVAVNVATVADFELGDNWVVNTNEYYCPIVIDVNGVQFCGLSYANADAFENAVENAISTYMSGSYAPGTKLDDESKLNDSIQWRWAFDKSDLDTTPSDSFGFTESAKAALGNQSDEKDTALGDKAANDADNAPTITLSITTTVTQID